MKTVVLVTCTSDKHRGTHTAGYIYTKSSNFRKYMELARVYAGDESIFVISALHGLLTLDTVIDWYNYTLSGQSQAIKNTWGEKVAEQIKLRFDANDTRFIVIAGADYYAPLMKHLPNIEVPLKGVSMYFRPAKVDEWISAAQHPVGNSICYRIHKLFNRMPRYKWDTIDKVGFDSGIYILFEVGEAYRGMDRIVRVGTHRSDGRLRGRLKDHFISQNNDGSIFRKNIGRAILNKNMQSYLSVWTKTKSRSDSNYDASFQKKIEDRVTRYMRDNFTFTCFPVEANAERSRLELGIIAALNNAEDFIASPDWRGQYSSEYEVVQSGMWLKEGLNDVPLSEGEFRRLEFLCGAAPSAPQRILRAEKQPADSFKPAFTRKYAPLTAYLQGITANEIAISLSDIEKIIGDKMAPSAYIHERWWDNYDETHPHRLGWINAGFEVTNGAQIKSTHKAVFRRMAK